MVRVSNPRLVELVLRLHSILKSGQKVSEELKKSPFSISRSGVYYILRKQMMIKNHGYHIEQLLNGKGEIENKEN